MTTDIEFTAKPGAEVLQDEPPHPLHGSNRLAVLAAEIKIHIAAGKKATQEAVISHIEIGWRLKEAKEDIFLGHGRFMQWVATTCEFSHSSALNCIALADAVDSKLIPFATVVNLGLKGAYLAIREEAYRQRLKLRDRKPGKAQLPSKKLARAETQWKRPDDNQILYIEWNREKYGYVWASGGDGVGTFDWILLDYSHDDDRVRNRSHRSSINGDGESWPTTWDKVTLGLLHEWDKNTDGVKRQEPWQKDPDIMQMLRHLQKNVAYELGLEQSYCLDMRGLNRQLKEARKELDALRELRPPSARLARLNGADSGREHEQKQQAVTARSATRRERTPEQKLDDED